MRSYLCSAASLLLVGVMGSVVAAQTIHHTVIGTDDGMVYCLGTKTPDRNVKDRAGRPGAGSHASNDDRP